MSTVLTPQGSKPYIKAFCPKTPLFESYPNKLFMRPVYQRGVVNNLQMKEINKQITEGADSGY